MVSGVRFVKMVVGVEVVILRFVVRDELERDIGEELVGVDV